MRESTLSEETKRELHAMARALPPLSDQQLDAIADILVQIELRQASTS